MGAGRKNSSQYTMFLTQTLLRTYSYLVQTYICTVSKVDNTCIKNEHNSICQGFIFLIIN